MRTARAGAPPSDSSPQGTPLVGCGAEALGHSDGPDSRAGPDATSSRGLALVAHGCYRSIVARMSAAPDRPLDELQLRYQRVQQALAEEIERGGRTPGARLPPERALAEHFGVSRVTLRRALDELSRAGLVRRSVSGWVVGQRHGRRAAERADELLGDSGVTRAHRRRPDARSGRCGPPTIDEAEALGLAPGAPLFELERMRTMDDVPILIDRTRIPLAVAPGIDDVDLQETSLYERARGALRRTACPSAIHRRGDRRPTRAARICSASRPVNRCCGASSRPRTRPAGRSSSARWSTATTGTGSAPRCPRRLRRWATHDVQVVDDVAGSSRAGADLVTSSVHADGPVDGRSGDRRDADGDVRRAGGASRARRRSTRPACRSCSSTSISGWSPAIAGRCSAGWTGRVPRTARRSTDGRVDAAADATAISTEACAAFDRTLEARGGIDLAILGLGANGHLGFNEPPSDAASPHPSGRADAGHDRGERALLGDRRRRPDPAVTLGMRPLLDARARSCCWSRARASARSCTERSRARCGADVPASFLRQARGT